MEQAPSLNADSSSASQKNRSFMEPKFRYPVQSNSQFVTTVSQLHPTHLPAYLF